MIQQIILKNASFLRKTGLHLLDKIGALSSLIPSESSQAEFTTFVPAQNYFILSNVTLGSFWCRPCSCFTPLRRLQRLFKQQSSPKLFKRILQAIYKIVDVKWNALDFPHPPEYLYSDEHAAYHEHEGWEILIMIEAYFWSIDDLSISVNVEVSHVSPAEASTLWGFNLRHVKFWHAPFRWKHKGPFMYGRSFPVSHDEFDGRSGIPFLRNIIRWQD